MTLGAGTRLGPYEILALLGSGGMGEVYRARDERLKREVAVKVLPSSFAQDPERLRRFEHEAQAAGGLNHPNITSVYELGSFEGSPYIVTELLEGDTLRVRLSGGALPVRKATDYGIQMARGLAAAHEKGIVHRDLKPENLFVTNDGRVKILDFGLAKLTQADGATGPQTNLPTVTGTEPGVVVGTLGYMAPEQVKGQRADARSDIFSFGAVLYEMLSGARAFQRDSAAETMSAILREEPPDLSATNKNVQPGLERVVRHCLEKSPEERFHSAHDLAFDLEALSGASSPATAAAGLAPSRLRRATLLAGGLALAGMAATFFLGRGTARTTTPSFQQLTFRRGAIHSARFAPDGQTVVYSAAWDGKPMEIYVGRRESPESRLFGLTNAEVLSVSATGEMAVSLDRRSTGFRRQGTLAQVSFAGGAAPREIHERIEWADWAPDGKSLAASMVSQEKMHIEYPLGKSVYETHGWVSHLRVSPDGELVAFADHPTPFDDSGFISAVDRSGKVRRLSPQYASVQGLAWSPDGKIFFTAAEMGGNRALWQTTRSGRVALRARVPGALTLQDVSRDGRLLVTRDTLRSEALGLGPAETKERDLTWLDWTLGADVSEDGRTFLFSETGEGGGAGYSVYLRKTDGSPAIRLGEGSAKDLSPDGEWALAIQGPTSPTPRLVAYPTRAGAAKVFATPGLTVVSAGFLHGMKDVVMTATEPGRGARLFVMDAAGGRPRALSPEGYFFQNAISAPDGSWVLATGPDRKRYLYPTSGGEPAAVAGLEQDDAVCQRSADGKALYVYQQGQAPVKVYRLDPATGRRELWRQLVPADAAGVTNPFPFPTPNGDAYVYGYFRTLSDVYVVEGLR